MILTQKEFTIFKFDRYFIEANNLEVEANTFKISGDNGQGKTTFLKSLYSGEWNGLFEIDGKSYKNNKIEIRNDFHFVYQEPLFVENTSIKYNLALYKVNLTKAIELLEPNIYDFNVKKNISKLSGGERQLINVVIAILSGKKYLLVDEPFNNLSEKNTKIILDLLMSFKGGLLIVDHTDAFQAEVALTLFKRKLYVK